MNASLRPFAQTTALSLDRPLSIALLGYRSHPHVGGQGIYLKYLSRALTQLGHKVDVLSGPPYPELDSGVGLIKIPSLDLYSADNHLTALRPRHLRSFTDTFEWWSMATGGFAEPYTFSRRVARYLRQCPQRYDVIHDNQTLGYGLLALQQDGFPLVTTIHHPITRDRQLAIEAAPTLGYKLLARRWYSFVGMQKQVARRLRHLVTVSEFSRQDIAAQFDRPAEGIEVITNGIDTQLFSPPPHPQRVPGRILTTTSSDQAIKGFGVLLHALQHLRTTLPEAHLIVVGKLDPGGSNQKLLEQLGLVPYVTFKPALSDAELVNEYSKTSVAVCPSLYEGFGLPAAEAMSCGVPLISSDGGALPEVVGRAGLLVPAGHSPALSEALLSVLTQPALAQKLSSAGRQRIKQNFCWQNVAQQMTFYYQQQLLAQPLCKPLI